MLTRSPTTKRTHLTSPLTPSPALPTADSAFHAAGSHSLFAPARIEAILPRASAAGLPKTDYLRRIRERGAAGAVPFVSLNRRRRNQPIRPLQGLIAALIAASLCAPVEPRPARAESRQQDFLPAAHVFAARDILEASLFRSPHYTIDEQVPLRDDRYFFTLHTADGPITAHGMPMLQVRLDEIESLQKAKKLDEEPQELEGFKESIKQTGRGFKSLFKDPGGTLSNVPRGVGRKIKSFGDRGGGTTRRHFAAAVGADPETDNPPLKKILDKLALRRGLGKGAVAVGGLVVTAGAANLAMVVRGAGALRVTADMNEAVRTLPLYKINENIAADLAEMGISEQDREAFTDHDAWTTVQRMLFLRQFKRLHAVTGSPLLVRSALRIHDRAGALGLVHSMELLARIHERSPLEEFMSSEYIAARLPGGSLLIVSDADYLTDAARLDRSAADLRAARAVRADAPLTLLLPGRIDPRARELLETRRIRIIENADTSAASP